MASKAQLKAIKKYNKEKTKTYLLRLNRETDRELIEILDNKDNKTGFIKKLLKAYNDGALLFPYSEIL